uniref:Reverse transcriptase Ty1/copia-type domain-containing protein n=1 Tax=Tanacetum cinerariifolium TaxID=118510 RepID=A0A6L2KA77_TANCI|nr:hypothetical protein [Tanacetum cinerariifolium]
MIPCTIEYMHFTVYPLLALLTVNANALNRSIGFDNPVQDPGSDDAKKKNIVKGLLFQSILEDLVLQIGNLKTGMDMWEAIKTPNLGADRVKEVTLQTLVTEFENMKMLDNGTIDEYAAKLSGIASKSGTLGEVMSEHKLVKKFLTSLPRYFVHIVAALEKVLYLKTTRFEDVVGRLKAKNDSSVGRGRGSYSRGRGRGRDQGRGRDNLENQGQRDSSKNRKDNEQKETIFMNEKKYTPPKSKSNTDDEDDAWFGDGSCGSIKGKGSILFQEKNKERKLLIDVYYIPAFRSNVISLGQATISGYDISIRAQLKVAKEDTNKMGWESDEEANPHSSSETVHSLVHETNPKSEEDKSGSDDMSIPIARLETIRLLIALAAGKGWKIHHLDVKSAFLNGDRKELDSTLKEMGFLQCVHEKAVYRKVFNGEFIIIAVYGDDIFVTGTSLDLINEFKRRMTSQFEMSDLGELTYYLGIEVSQGKDCLEIKQERCAMKILKEAGMEDCKQLHIQWKRISSCQNLRMNQKLKLPNIEKWWVPYVTSCTLDIVIVVIMLTLMMDEVLLDMFSISVHHPLHGAHKSKLQWHSLRVKLSSWQPLQLRVKQFGLGSYW